MGHSICKVELSLTPEPVMTMTTATPCNPNELDAEHAPLEQVEETICRWAARLASATCTWLAMIAAFDRRQGWAGLGMSSCAHWLAWRCGLDLRTAREHLTTAHALESLPTIRAAFASGELSFSKVRAITRIAGPNDEHDWLDHARRMSAGKLEQHIRGQRQRDADPAKLRAARKLAIRSTNDGMVQIVATLAPDDAVILLAALDAARTSLETGQRTVPGERPSQDPAPAPSGPPEDGEIVHAPRGQARDADALIALAEAFFHYQAPHLQNSPHTLTFHITAPGEVEGPHESQAGDGSEAHDEPVERPNKLPSGIASVGRWNLGLPAGMVARLGCDALIRALLTDGQNNPLRLGRRHRLPSGRLRDSVYARDQGTCQFPGCDHTEWLQIHHCDEWAAGNGRTDVEVLLLICGTHHRAIHDQYLTVSRHNDGSVTVRAPDGQAITSMPGPILFPTIDRNAIPDLDKTYGLIA
ncbi:HNH nuclease domain-containing protein [Frankia sp. AiPs1]